MCWEAECVERRRACFLSVEPQGDSTEPLDVVFGSVKEKCRAQSAGNERMVKKVEFATKNFKDFHLFHLHFET